MSAPTPAPVQLPGLGFGLEPIPWLSTKNIILAAVAAIIIIVFLIIIGYLSVSTEKSGIGYISRYVGAGNGRRFPGRRFGQTS